jgi:hypothetical protein
MDSEEELGEIVEGVWSRRETSEAVTAASITTFHMKESRTFLVL